MEQFSLWGSVVNVLAILLGSGSVLLVKTPLKRIIQKRSKNTDSSDKPASTLRTRIADVSDAVMKGLALSILMVGISGLLKGQNTLVIILSMVIGATLGTLLDLDRGINIFGDWVEKKTRGIFGGNVSQGLVSATLLFSVGAMAVVGSLQSGLRLDHTTLYTKSLLDLCSSAVLAATMGFGVTLSAIPVFVFQGSITLGAVWLSPFLSDAVVNEMTAVGSLLIIALALNLIANTKIKVMNYLPAVFLPILLTPLFS